MGKYDPWDPFFASVEGDDVTFTMAELEHVLGQVLPPSARRYQEWWASAQYYAKWVEHGFVASPDLSSERVRFRRREVRRRSIPGATEPALEPIGLERRFVLLGCVSEKRTTPAAAKDLYISALWQKRRSYAESTRQPWAILSAEHGLVMPETVLAPYDRSLKDEPAEYRKRWSQQVSSAVIEQCRKLGISAVEVHAGSAYLENGLIATLNQAEIHVLWPLRGKRIGEQLAWYGSQSTGQRTSPAASAEDPASPPSAEVAEQLEGTGDMPFILSMAAIGPFEFRWPDAVESFDRGWEGEVETRGHRSTFRHGLGGQVVYGANRVHTVTWLDGNPTVEGVAADDYPASRAMLSRIKRPDGSMARSPSEVPPSYLGFHVVDQRAEIDAPYSPSGMAVKIRVDDVPAWINHAVLRMTGKAQKGDSRPTTAAKVPIEDDAKAPLEPLSNGHKRAVAQALVDFAPAAAEIAGDIAGPSFASHADANRLLVEDPFAFLLAVIADYQIPAERAWALPYLLKQRLGHLDLHRMLAEPDAVAEAVARRPSLHRYVNNVPSYFIEACRIVLDRYGGNAGRIWANEPTAIEVQTRLQLFPGISQKKAAMAVEILERDFGVPIRDMQGSDIAFDVHIRRVFLRSGLAEVDDQDHMIDAARHHWPERPGLLDLPAWVIGRNWCRPRDPDCGSCPITSACAQRIDAAEGVRGA